MPRRRRSWVRAVGVAAALIVGGTASAAPAAEISPDADLCAALEALGPGEELVLQPGDYRAGCVVRRGGLPRAPIVIRGADPERRPRLTADGRSANLLQIRAGDLVLRGLDFGPGGDADGVRIIYGNRVTVEDCRFLRLGGIAVVANHTSIDGLTVRRNQILESNATGMYFGCHDGLRCTVTRLVVEHNYINGVKAPPGEIGYGLEVKLNSTGTIRDNVVVNTKGPGIMVYGSRDLIGVSTIERNFVSGSAASSGIVIGGGPALVRNNVAVGNVDAGIGLENYGRRGLLRAISVVHNSVYSNLAGGIAAPEQGPVEAVLIGNAVHARAGTPALPSPRMGVRLAGNVDCTWVPCFTSPEALNFSPYPGSVLVGSSVPRAADGLGPSDDFFGARRGLLPTVGAIERASGPIHLGVKP
jgi:hypothetical protein